MMLSGQLHTLSWDSGMPTLNFQDGLQSTCDSARGNSNSANSAQVLGSCQVH